MESWALRQCNHPNIIAWVDLFEDQRFFILVCCLVVCMRFALIIRSKSCMVTPGQKITLYKHPIQSPNHTPTLGVGCPSYKLPHTAPPPRSSLPSPHSSPSVLALTISPRHTRTARSRAPGWAGGRATIYSRRWRVCASRKRKPSGYSARLVSGSRRTAETLLTISVCCIVPASERNVPPRLEGREHRD